jgi:hypothetical protein
MKRRKYMILVLFNKKVGLMTYTLLSIKTKLNFQVFVLIKNIKIITFKAKYGVAHGKIKKTL